MRYSTSRLFIILPSVVGMLACSAATLSQEAAFRVDLTKPPSGITNDTARLILHGVPPEEAKAKNESYLSSPALVVGPVMEGVGRPRLCRWRHEVLGHRVEVEGIALGAAPQQPSHMTTQRVIYEGGMIFIKGVDFAKSEATGKLVRIGGTLRLEPERVMEFDGHEPITVEKYYYIDAEKLDVVQQVTESCLVAPQLHR
jgi:hypothetical protein